MTNTIDEILLKPASWKLDDYTRASEDLYQLILAEVIGEDEKHLNGQKMVNPTIDCNECDQPGASFIRNELRAEQRQTLAKLFNEEKNRNE